MFSGFRYNVKVGRKWENKKLKIPGEGEKKKQKKKTVLQHVWGRSSKFKSHTQNHVGCLIITL